MVGGDATAVGPQLKVQARGKGKRLMRDEQHNAVGVSNATNSRSPNDLRSRIFIGNLNTTLVTKRHLHIIFASYGDVKAISMHKGFAFIQYGDEFDALNAVFAQDGQLLSGQAIDVNLVTEPKPHQKACKKVLISGEPSSSDGNGEANDKSAQHPTTEDEVLATEIDAKCSRRHSEGNSSSDADNDGLTEDNASLSSQADLSSLSAIFFDGSAKRGPGPPSTCSGSELGLNAMDEDEMLTDSSAANPEKVSSDVAHSVSALPAASSATPARDSSHGEAAPCKRFKLDVPVTSMASFAPAHLQPQFDVLICGNCRTLFTSLSNFVQHKKMGKCRLRFVCHCGPSLSTNSDPITQL